MALAGQAGRARLDAAAAQLELASAAGAAALGARTLTLSDPDGARAAIRAEDGASALTLTGVDLQHRLELVAAERGAALRVVAGAREAQLRGDALTLTGPDGSAHLTGLHLPPAGRRARSARR